MGTIRVTNDYPVAPDALWDISTDMGAMARTMKGLLRYDGLVPCRAHMGLVLRYGVSLFGILPSRPCRVEFVAFDEDAMTFETVETGPGLRSWNHRMRVVPAAGGSRLVEAVEIEAEAAWQTPLFERFARHVYRRRHAPRLAMLMQGGGPGAQTRLGTDARNVGDPVRHGFELLAAGTGFVAG